MLYEVITYIVNQFFVEFGTQCNRCERLGFTAGKYGWTRITSYNVCYTKLLRLNRSKEKFLLHYNFPPFSTGEAKAARGISRREIGHGNLAHRALKRMLPDAIPYTVRVVSDILESNGSSSMATVCAGTLALMDAGIVITSYSIHYTKLYDISLITLILIGIYKKLRQKKTMEMVLQ